MIGILSNLLEAYPIIYKIHENINTDIYVSNNIVRLLENKCKIIITKEETKQYKDTIVIDINSLYNDNYTMLDKNLLDKKDNIKDYLSNLKPTNPIVLRLKEEYLYEEIKKYSNNIITTSDLVLNKVVEIIKNNNIKLTNSKNAYYIK